MTETKKSEWNSNFAFMMAMIGSAVGLGNIWRFPKNQLQEFYSQLAKN